MRFNHSPLQSFTQQSLRCKAHAPGRINLIGEYTDFNGGKVLPFAMQLGIELQLFASMREVQAEQAVYEVSSAGHDGVFTVDSQELQALTRQLSVDPLSADLRGLLPQEIADSWARYALGALVWHQHSRQKFSKSAMAPAVIHLKLASNLPSGAGVSSSAALCSGILAILAHYHQLPLSSMDLARQAMCVEHQFAGTRCGLMDQTAIALSEAKRLLLIDFKNLNLSGEVVTRKIEIHPAFDSYRCVLINTKVKHELGLSPYNERRRDCEEGLRRLQAATGQSGYTLGHFAADLSFLQDFAADGHQSTLRENLSQRVFPESAVLAKRLAHAIMENLRVDAAVKALESGDLLSLTAALNGSHCSLRDDFEVSCFELDLIREQALTLATTLAEVSPILPILGSRMTGGGFGGSTIQLVHESILERFREAIVSPRSVYVQETGLVPELLLTDFAGGLVVHSQR